MLSALVRLPRARGSRPAAGRDQLPARATRPRSRTSRSRSRDLAGVHFTGSTGVFNAMWKTIGENMARYKSYPRIVGETGGKDFIVAHPSADPAALAVAIARGGFEYQGQKCSAASRVYVPRSLWREVRDRAVGIIDEHPDGRRPRLPQLHGRGDRQEGVRQDQRVHRRSAKKSAHDRRRRQGRRRDAATSSRRRWSRRSDPGYRLLCEEIFGPVRDRRTSTPTTQWHETLRRSSIARRPTR